MPTFLYLEIADPGGALLDRREPRSGQLVRTNQFVPCGQRAHADFAVFSEDAMKVKAPHIYEQARPGQTELHRRHQRLAAGEHLRFRLAESIECLLDGGRPHEADLGRNHPLTSPEAARMASTMGS